ncbi:hypothetical protein [Sphingomonas turrisvirgatae]|nr:hypothetical protein [Sphingomonas turrisvirgatae]
MRQVDRMECAAFGHGAKDALRRGLIESCEAWTAKIDDVPVAMFGCVTVSAIEGEGRPWFLGTDAVYRRGADMLRIGPVIIDKMLDSRRELRNLVASGNGRAIRLLERWGFTVEEGEQMIGGLAFREFWMKRDV